jgi:hypothetical protein
MLIPPAVCLNPTLSQTADIPVIRVSNDNGQTFGPMLMLATNGTIGEVEVEAEPEERE